MKSHLPNCRWLAVESEEAGRDWNRKAQSIDDHLEGLGMDLAEESVYLLYEDSPEAILEGDSLCQVARSVIGPKKTLSGDLKLKDWVQAPVHRSDLSATEWDDLLLECQKEWKILKKEGVKLASGFMIVVKRRLSPALSITSEVLFYE